MGLTNSHSARYRKTIALLRRPPDMPWSIFHERWAKEGADRAGSAPSSLAAYVQNPARIGAYAHSDPAFDGYAEIWHRADGAAPLTSLERCCDVLLLPVEVHVIRDGHPPVDAVKSIELIHRRADLPEEDFRHYWRKHHGPLACAIPFLRYEQNHVVADAGISPPFDGAAVTWFASTADMRANVGTPAYTRTRDDEPNFLALPSIVLLTDSRVIIPPP